MSFHDDISLDHDEVGYLVNLAIAITITLVSVTSATAVLWCLL